MKRITLMSFVVLLSAGCLDVDSNGGFVFSDYEGLLDAKLRPGAVNAWNYGDVTDWNWSRAEGFDAQLTSFAVPGGLDAYVDPYRREDEQPGGLIYGMSLGPQADGSVTRRPGYRSGDLLSSALIGTTTVQLWCDQDGLARLEYVTDTLDPEAFDADELCSTPGLLGRGTEGYVIVVSRASSTAYEIAVETKSIASINLPDAVDAADIVFIDKPSATDVAVVTTTSTGFAYARTGVTSITATIDGELSGFEPVRRDDDGWVRIVTTSGLYRWNVDGDGEVVTLATSTDPTISATWQNTSAWRGGLLAVETIVNPLDATLEIPVSVQARWEEGDTLVVQDLPPTPCVLTEECRTLGETRVIGLFGDLDRRWIAYEMWSWWDLRGVWLVPLTD